MPSKSCPLCSSKLPQPYWPTVWNAPNKRVMFCPSCDSFFLDPPETEDEQRKFDVGYDRYIQARSELLSKHIPQTFDTLVDESIEIRFQDLKQFFEGSPTVLEVGAEKGGFLDRIAHTAGSMAAVDSCPEYIDILKNKGYPVFSYVWDLPPSVSYDRICLFSLLEHVHSPLPFLTRLKDCLTPAGLMILEIPSANEPLLSLYDVSAFKSFYFQAMHPYVYSEKAIRMLLVRCGMVVEKIMYKQRYGLANHLQWLKDGTPGGSAHFSSIFAGHADSEYLKSLEASGHTDTLYVVARKA
jgi:SAM-dependent methyltransferase